LYLFILTGVRKPSPESSLEEKCSLSALNTLAKSFTAKTLENILNCSNYLEDWSVELKHTKVRQNFVLIFGLNLYYS